MPLENLLELVRTLSSRIDEHGAALRQSEALTRYALIDPLLRELGWDTSDPGMVIPEYRSGSGSADYALLSSGQPAMMVEAKKLGTALGYDVISQILTYCQIQGTGFFCVTDGRIWEIYETHKPVPIDDKRIVRFDLKDNPAQACLSALALWRPSVESGYIAVGQSPIAELSQNQLDIQQIQSPTIEEPTTQPMHTTPAPDVGNWLSLSELNPESGDPAPSEILLPDRSTRQIGNWNSVIVEVVRWLTNANLLGSSHCPIKGPSARRRYIVNTAPIHMDGETSFSYPVEVGSFYIETNANARTLIGQTRVVIEHVGQDPAQFKVRLT